MRDPYPYKQIEVSKLLMPGFMKYVVSKVGPEKAKRTTWFTEVDTAYQAFEALSPEYDLGIGIAKKGLGISYIFHLCGFPVKTVEVKRRGRGATWNPIDKISQKDIKDQRIILFENDVLTGRSLRRVVREINKLSPQYIDLLLNFPSVPITPETYKKYSHYFPTLEELFSFKEHLQEVKLTEEGLEVTYLKHGYIPKIVIHKNKDIMAGIKCKKNIPKEIRKIFTLYEDFNNESFESLEKLERLIKENE